MLEWDWTHQANSVGQSSGITKLVHFNHIQLFFAQKETVRTIQKAAAEKYNKVFNTAFEWDVARKMQKCWDMEQS